MKEKDSERYIRVGTTLYKIVLRPLMSGDFIEERRPQTLELRNDSTRSLQRLCFTDREVRRLLFRTQSCQLSAEYWQVSESI